jgi:hypothetical protein
VLRQVKQDGGERDGGERDETFGRDLKWARSSLLYEHEHGDLVP